MASVICEIPIDLFISRKRRLGFTHGDLMFTDGSGKLIFRLLDNRSSSSSSTTITTKDKSKRSPRVVQLLDDKGNPIFSISRNDVGWQGCRGDSKDVIFEVKKTLQSFWRREVEVFLGSDSSGGFNSILKMRGFPFQRSCTIYEGNSVVGQTSLMYKLGMAIVRRRRFRLTIFPGSIDHALLVALIVIYYQGNI
ncbi:Lurp-one-related [Thalictrum thalictroides]|uniref:Lurp-one-related n=1 Tax=Thalictrum thalictroides TaxID=46969 RepID=A0A7J6W4N9_THATH|nr:Lurp-one-related [Thalictrum thalictroides]